MKLRPVLYIALGAMLSLVAIVSYSFKPTDPKDATATVQNDVKPQNKWTVPDVPRSMTFAGEPVPLERRDVYEQLQRELLVNYYYESGTLYLMLLTTRYMPFIEGRLKANGVPDDFKYLCVAESALQNVTSKAGAVGFWQFMKDTGPKYGLMINDEVDERYNVEKATDAACRYFKEAYGRFGTWTGAAASYNCGLTGFDNFTTYQRTKNYYDLLLPDETMRYVFRILALKYILTQADKLGFIIAANETYKPYKTRTVSVTASIPDIAQYAIDNGTNYRTLRTLNPWLRNHTLTVRDGQSFDIQLPAGN